MSHTAECEAARAKVRAERDAYETAWPNYCRQCGGYGAIGGGYDSSTGMTDVEPCPCSEEGRCPRCGERNLTEPFDRCPDCGWTDQTAGLTGEPECICPFYGHPDHDPWAAEPTAPTGRGEEGR